MEPGIETPLVSVITPSLNMASFIEETIRSVLAQDYPSIEYWIVDGGSTDGTLEILEKYRDSLRFVSRPDPGTAFAVNQGVELSRGTIVAWLSADDTYLPGAISQAVKAFAAHPEAAVVYGEGLWVDGDGKAIGPYPVHPLESGLLERECIICQPAAFIRREVFKSEGGLDHSLRTSFDYDLWIRLGKRYSMVKISQLMATSRMHLSNQSLGQRRQVYLDTFRVLRRHYGYIPAQWVYGYACLILDRRDQFFEPLRRSVPAYLLSLLQGLWRNHSSALRFLKEWVSLARAGSASV